jgi:hypothetical protein
MSYIPTESDRCNVAAAYDNCYKGPADETYSAAAYVADGCTVTLADGNGATYWIYSLDEAKECGVCREEGEVIKIGRRNWIIVTA